LEHGVVGVLEDGTVVDAEGFCGGGANDDFNFGDETVLIANDGGFVEAEGSCELIIVGHDSVVGERGVELAGVWGGVGSAGGERGKGGEYYDRGG